MIEYDSTGPVEVVDRLLWRDAQQMLSRHCGANPDGRCQWCDRPWPCPARRLAERAEIAACRPRWDTWTAWHDPEAGPLAGGPERGEPAGRQVAVARVSLAGSRVASSAVVHPLAPSTHSD